LCDFVYDAEESRQYRRGRPGHLTMLKHKSKLGELCPPTFETYPKLTSYIVNNVDTVSAKKIVVVLDMIESDCIPRFLD
jgi:hypothetical protein